MPVANVYVCVSPTSASVVVNVPTTVPAGWFSATLALESARSVGAALLSHGKRLIVDAIERSVLAITGPGNQESPIRAAGDAR